MTLYAYCGNDPVNRYDDDGMVWKKIKKKAKSVAKKIIPAAKKIVRTSIRGGHKVALSLGVDTAQIGGKLLNMKKDKKGIYHANFNGWQQHFGYNKFYDFMFDLGADMKSTKISFTHNKVKYVLWAWKGDYINLGAGAEMGIYYGGGPHWRVNKSLAMPMSLKLKHKGKTTISYSENTWWITGFNAKLQNVKSSNLTATFTINFSSNKGMFNSLYTQNKSRAGLSFNTNKHTVTYTF